MARVLKLSPPALFRAVENAVATFETFATAHDAVRRGPGYMYDEKDLPMTKDQAIATLDFLYHIATSKDRRLAKQVKQYYPSEYKELRSVWFRKRLISHAMLLAHYRPTDEANLCNKYDGGHAILMAGLIMKGSATDRTQYFGLRLSIDEQAKAFANRLETSDLIVEIE